MTEDEDNSEFLYNMYSAEPQSPGQKAKRAAIIKLVEVKGNTRKIYVDIVAYEVPTVDHVVDLEKFIFSQSKTINKQNKRLNRLEYHILELRRNGSKTSSSTSSSEKSMKNKRVF